VTWILELRFVANIFVGEPQDERHLEYFGVIRTPIMKRIVLINGSHRFE
jgi:hypothetical protein